MVFMEPSCCHEKEEKLECHQPAKKWYKNKLILITVFAVVFFLAGYIIPVLKPFQHSFLMYLKMIWWALLVGFLLAGLIDRYIPSEYVSKFLARPQKRTIFYAAGLGLIMSACCHGILAVSMELHKKGASGPAVVSFLLGSPWANLPVTILLISLFHLKGLLIIGAALFVALNTGLIFMILDSLGWIEKNPHTVSVESSFSIREDLKKRWREYHLTKEILKSDALGVFKGSMNMAKMILWWIVLGIVMASLVGAFVPPHIFTDYFGPTLTGLLLTLAAATVIEICSEGSAPVAFEVYNQTHSIGNAFVFLMGGVVTDYTEVGLIWQNLGRKTALWMVVLTVPQVIFLGWIFNVLFGGS